MQIRQLCLAQQYRLQEQQRTMAGHSQASHTEEQIRVHEQALKRLERVSTLRAQVVQELRVEGERVLAALRAEEQTSRQQPQLQR